MTKRTKQSIRRVLFAAAIGILAPWARAANDELFDGGAILNTTIKAGLGNPGRPTTIVAPVPQTSDDPIPLPEGVKALREFVETNRGAILKIDGITKVDWGWPDGDKLVSLWIEAASSQSVIDEFYARFPQAKQWDLMWFTPDDRFGGFIQHEAPLTAMTTGPRSAAVCHLDETLQNCIFPDGHATTAVCGSLIGPDGTVVCGLKDAENVGCDTRAPRNCFAIWSP